jgi:hypothetical protein
MTTRDSSSRERTYLTFRRTDRSGPKDHHRGQPSLWRVHPGARPPHLSTAAAHPAPEAAVIRIRACDETATIRRPRWLRLAPVTTSSSLRRKS